MTSPLSALNKIPVLAVAIVFTCFIQECVASGTISGQVRDYTNGRPIPYADIEVENCSKIRALKDGAYIIDCPTGNGYILQISAQGYETETIVGLSLADDQYLIENVKLKPIRTAPPVRQPGTIQAQNEAQWNKTGNASSDEWQSSTADGTMSAYQDKAQGYEEESVGSTFLKGAARIFGKIQGDRTAEKNISKNKQNDSTCWQDEWGNVNCPQDNSTWNNSTNQQAFNQNCWQDEQGIVHCPQDQTGWTDQGSQQSFDNWETTPEQQSAANNCWQDESGNINCPQTNDWNTPPSTRPVPGKPTAPARQPSIIRPSNSTTSARNPLESEKAKSETGFSKETAKQALDGMRRNKGSKGKSAQTKSAANNKTVSSSGNRRPRQVAMKTPGKSLIPPLMPVITKGMQIRLITDSKPPQLKLIGKHMNLITRIAAIDSRGKTDGNVLFKLGPKSSEKILIKPWANSHARLGPNQYRIKIYTKNGAKLIDPRLLSIEVRKPARSSSSKVVKTPNNSKVKKSSSVVNRIPNPGTVRTLRAPK